MKIEKCAGTNIKGQTFALDLGPFTMIIGAHRAGKTARLDAIRLGLLGYVPLIGKTNIATFSLASGSQMSVTLKADCGSAHRVWKQNVGQSVLRKDEVDSAIPETPEILLDSRSFFAMTPAAKTKWAFEHAKLDTNEFSPSAVVAKVKVLRMDPHTENHEKALAKIVDDLTDSAMSMRGADITLQDWLVAEGLSYAEKVASAKASVDRMEKLVAGMVQLETQDLKRADLSIKDATEALAALTAERDKWQSEKGRLAALLDTARAQRLALPGLKVRAEIDKDGIAQLPGWKIGRDELKASVEAYVSKRPEADALLAKAVTDLNKAIVSGSGVRLEAKYLRETLAEEVAKDKRRHAFLDGIKDISERWPRLAEDILMTQQKIHDLTIKIDADKSVCETCKQPLPANAELRESRSRWESDLRTLKIQLDQISTFESALSQMGPSQTVDLGVKLKTSEEAIATFEDCEQQARISVDEAKAKVALATVNDATHSMARDGLVELSIKIAEVEKALSERDSIHAKIAAMPSDADVEALRNQEAGCTDRLSKNAELIKGAQTQLARAGAAKQDLLRKLQAVQERNVAAADHEVLKAVLQEIRAYQLVVLDGAFQPFLKKANRVVLPMLGAPLSVEEGEVGYRQGGRFIFFKSFSGLEQALTTMAMCFALADGAPCKVVVMDEMRAINDSSKSALIAVINDLLKDKVIDQFIGADTDVHPYIDPDTVKDHFPGAAGDTVPMGKPYKEITVITI